jgi:hypothetical protein
MKTLKALLLFSLIIPFIACNAQNGKKENQSTVSNKVEVYYFHFNARCETCRTVESEAKADIESLYGGKVTFKAVNLDDKSSKVLAEKLQVSGQSLLIVKGSEKINITNEGFLYARTNPEKFKSVIKEKVDSVLK